MLIFGFLIIFLVYRENTYASATIGVVPGQTVVSTGLYALVRHPMYMGALVWLTGMALALGSWWALCIFFPMLAALVWRLIAEEKFLAQHLQGYAAYRKTTRFRLIPFVW
jgi:protein-S-isoprenylcysteine O-methyltransferase Ste14